MAMHTETRSLHVTTLLSSIRIATVSGTASCDDVSVEEPVLELLVREEVHVPVTVAVVCREQST